MPTDSTANLEDTCLHCQQTLSTYAASCCEAALRDDEVIRYLPLLAANDFLAYSAEELH